MLSGIFTLAAFASFLGIALWAWSDRNKARFSEAANLPLQEDEALTDSTHQAGDAS